MLVCETFLSIQGEGLLTGRPTFFIRTAGCELECSWCDTQYAKEEGEPMDFEEITEKVREHHVLDVCITGGEPMEQADLVPLCKRLMLLGCRVLVETNGAHDITPLTKMGPALLVSMDLKCPSSGMHEEMRMENLAQLREIDQVKFTVTPDDLAFVKRTLSEHRTCAEKIVQPVWGTDLAPLVQQFLDEGIDARFMLQTHKVIWGPERKGV